MRTIARACMLGLGVLCLHLHLFSQQVARLIPNSTSPDGHIGFLEFKPKDYGSQQHPLIIFLHGIGERGNGTTDINDVAANAIPKFCAAGATMRFTVSGVTSSFVVLSPQLSTQYGYWPTFYVKEMIKYAKANLQIDPNRIYITGLSLGGGGVWRSITEVTNNDYSFDAGIAAAAPCCGTQDEQDATVCSTIAANHLPVWAFHCMDDGTVPVGCTQHAQILLSWCGAMTPAAKFTYYQNGGHGGAWTNAFDTGHITTTISGGGSFTANPNLYEWFLGNKRSGGTSPVYTAPTVNAGSAQIITLPVSAVTLSGTGSGTGGATITSYSWAKTSGPAEGVISLPLASTTSVTGLVQGTYVFTLTVQDDHDLTASSNVTITVNAASTTTGPSDGNLLGYIKMSYSPYMACDDNSAAGRIAVYGKSIANGSYLYTDAAMTKVFSGGWNWFSFTNTPGAATSNTFAVYPIGIIFFLRDCGTGSRVAGTAVPSTTVEEDDATLRHLRDSAAGVSVADVKNSGLSLYPNPVQANATIELNSADNGAKIINLYNAGGVLKAKYTWQTIKGNNIFSLKDISELSGGLYIIDIRDSNGKRVGALKFIKQ